MSKKKKKKTEPPQITTEEAVVGLEAYSVHVILYINDYAANYCLEICNMAEKEHFNGNGVKKICVGLKRRANEYFSTFNTVFRSAIDSLATFNSYYDDKCDEACDKFKESIKNALSVLNVEHKNFIASVETCRSIVEFACDANDHIVEETKQYSKDLANQLPLWKPIYMLNAIQDLSDFVCDMIPHNEGVDLNKDENIISSFQELNDAIFSYKSFKKAYRKTYINQ